MALYGQTITVNGPGLGLVEAAPTTPLVLGVCSVGTANTLYTCQNKNSAITQLGQGPLAEAVCHALDVAGGPVLDEGVPDYVKTIVEKHHPPLPIVLVNGNVTPLGRISLPLLQKEIEKINI